jgi:hypothetical protein
MNVTYVRVVELPDQAAQVQYEVRGDDVTVWVRAEMITEAMAAAASQMWTEILSESFQPKTQLRLVEGTG